MSLSKLTSKDLNAIAQLIEKKEGLLRQVDEINAELSQYQGTDSAPKPAPGRKRRVGRASKKTKMARQARKGAARQKRGVMKDRILSELQNAGENGATVKELAGKLGTKPANVSVWFYTTGAKLPNIKKVAPATYAMK